MTSYDVIVIGAGPVGENVADRAVQGGLSVVIVESELVGGECSYWACMPSKALLRAGAVLRAAADVDGARQSVTGGVDAAGVLRRRDAMVHDWSDEGQVAWLDGAHIDLVRGHGRLSGPKQVTVTAPDGAVTVLTAQHAVAVCTGSAALLPDVPGLAGIRPWTSREATSVREIPESLAVIGGGVVACEMATAFADLGCRVTMVVRSRLLSAAEPFAGELVQRALEERGVTVLTQAGVASASRKDAGDDVDAGAAVLTLTDGREVVAAEVLVAAGRVPRTADLGLETAGLGLDAASGWLDVDDTMLVTGAAQGGDRSGTDSSGSDRPANDRPTNDWLYAVGDVNHRALLTHQGKYQARVAGDVIVARARGGVVDDAPWGVHVATADHGAVPQVVFTDPEVASVGLTAADAERAGMPVRVRDYDLSWVAGASEAADHYRGQARIVIDDRRDVIVGATFAGPGVAELLHAATIAVVGEVPLRRLWHAVPSYPTVSEAWLRLLEADGRPTPSR